MAMRWRVELTVESIFVSESKAEYIAKRKIDISHISEAVKNEPRYFARQDASSRIEYSMLGRTNNGRFLLVAIEPLEDDSWRLITAYWLREREGRRRFEGNDEEADR